MCLGALALSDFLSRSFLKTHERTHTHTFYGFDVSSTYALVVGHFGVTYTLPHCKALDIALAIYVKENVLPTCITEMPCQNASPRDSLEERSVTGGGSLCVHSCEW